jgi:hypothetical protein
LALLLSVVLHCPTQTTGIQSHTSHLSKANTKPQPEVDEKLPTGAAAEVQRLTAMAQAGGDHGSVWLLLFTLPPLLPA